MSPYSLVKLERFDQVARVTVDRPDARNALNSELLAELTEAMAEAAADPDTRVVVFTGAGDRAFIAGADIKEMSQKSPEQGREFAKQGLRLTGIIEEMEKPVIAAINGVALGGGCELAIACDIRIAGDRAMLGQPEVKLGIMPGWGGTFRLARIVGEGKAREMIFTGRVLTAEEAHRIGLLNAVVPHERLPEEAMKLAGEMAAAAPIALAHAKRSMNRARSLDMDSALELETSLFALCFSTEDQREGMGAYIEKRTPVFHRR